MMTDLVGGEKPRQSTRDEMAERAVLLRGFALDREDDLLAAIREIAIVSPFRNMVTPGGHVMSVAMTNCGRAASPDRTQRLAAAIMTRQCR